MAGFEPADEGVKVPCLTPWLHPYIKFKKLGGSLKTTAEKVGWIIGLEPTTSRATIWRSSQLSYIHHTGALEGTRTPGLLLRRQLLYPAELQAHTYGAGDGSRTHTTSLEGWNSTAKLHPHL